MVQRVSDRMTEGSGGRKARAQRDGGKGTAKGGTGHGKVAPRATDETRSNGAAHGSVGAGSVGAGSVARSAAGRSRASRLASGAIDAARSDEMTDWDRISSSSRAELEQL